MPDSEPPAQTQVNGTINTAAHERVVAPTRNPSGNCSKNAPGGGELRSGPLDETSPAISENRKVLPQARQSARSVDTLMSSTAIADRHAGQIVLMRTNYATSSWVLRPSPTRPGPNSCAARTHHVLEFVHPRSNRRLEYSGTRFHIGPADRTMFTSFLE